jgi:hypothetical protein
MKSDEKRNSRIMMLYQKAMTGKYTAEGKFSMNQLIDDAKVIGVSQKTAEGYAEAVVGRLVKGGHLNV